MGKEVQVDELITTTIVDKEEQVEISTGSSADVKDTVDFVVTKREEDEINELIREQQEEEEKEVQVDELTTTNIVEKEDQIEISTGSKTHVEDTGKEKSCKVDVIITTKSEEDEINELMKEQQQQQEEKVVEVEEVI